MLRKTVCQINVKNKNGYGRKSIKVETVLKSVEAECHDKHSRTQPQNTGLAVRPFWSEISGERGARYSVDYFMHCFLSSLLAVINSTSSN
jgi:hypothetical protein